MKIDCEKGAHTSHRPPKCAARTKKSHIQTACGWSEFQFRREPVSLFSTANTLRSIRKQQAKQEHQTKQNERSPMNEPNFKFKKKSKPKHNANTRMQRRRVCSLKITCCRRTAHEQKKHTERRCIEIRADASCPNESDVVIDGIVCVFCVTQSTVDSYSVLDVCFLSALRLFALSLTCRCLRSFIRQNHNGTHAFSVDSHLCCLIWQPMQQCVRSVVNGHKHTHAYSHRHIDCDLIFFVLFRRSERKTGTETATKPTAHVRARKQAYRSHFSVHALLHRTIAHTRTKDDLSLSLFLPLAFDVLFIDRTFFFVCLIHSVLLSFLAFYRHVSLAPFCYSLQHSISFTLSPFDPFVHWIQKFAWRMCMLCFAAFSVAHIICVVCACVRARKFNFSLFNSFVVDCFHTLLWRWFFRLVSFMFYVCLTTACCAAAYPIPLPTIFNMHTINLNRTSPSSQHPNTLLDRTCICFLENLSAIFVATKYRLSHSIHTTSAIHTGHDDRIQSIVKSTILFAFSSQSNSHRFFWPHQFWWIHFVRCLIPFFHRFFNLCLEARRC